MVETRKLQGQSGSGASALFQLLRDGNPRTRAELATVTGLARSTIAQRIGSLIDLGFVTPVGDAASTGGRPSSQFSLNHSARLIIGADLGASHISLAITDLAARPLAEVRANMDITDGPEKVLSFILDRSTELLESLGRSLDDVLAIGLGLPGPVEHATGLPINPPIMPGWDRFDVSGWLRNRVDVPVLVDNDVNVMALGARSLAFATVDDLLFMKVATGIGAGVISNGELLRGAQGIAGDIGHVQVARAAGIACRCGSTGCLEAVASGPAIASALARAGLDVDTPEQVVELVKAGNVEAIQAVRQAGRDIGDVLTTCVSLINPSVIVLGGSMALAGEHLIAGVREVVYTRSMPLATEHLSIVQSGTNDRAGVIGASILALSHVLSPESIDAMVA